ncbi:YLL058W-like protein [Zygosaccharomyces rouxii]|nr:YLL058W-like protein [Zygosaccharomyces rouxii]
MTEIDFGQPLPSNLEYAVSFGIPTWDSAIGYAEKTPETINKMTTGYPRYFPQPPVQKLCKHFIKKFGKISEDCRPFPSIKEAQECLKLVKLVTGSKCSAHLEVETFELENHEGELSGSSDNSITIAAALASDTEFDIVREYWKLRGECVSSRLADNINQLLDSMSTASSKNKHEVETRIRLSRNEGENAKKLIKRRLVENHCNPFGLTRKNSVWDNGSLDPERDVYLVSSGMSSIFAVRRFLTFWEEKRASDCSLTQDGSSGKKDVSLCNTAAIFGFPFKDTQVIMKTFGTCQFYGFGDSRDISSLKKFLNSDKQRILAVFIETPSNPLLNMPDLLQLRKLADEYGFFIIIDDTIGGLNVDTLPYADIICTSLTKLFNGSSNVMGGSLILNPKSSLYPSAREYFASSKFEDLLWGEDAVVLEENSRDFEDRTTRANENTEILLNELLLPLEGRIFKKIYYPSVSSKETFANYEAVRNKKGGYGCLFSMSFFNQRDAVVFYDSLKVFKGPSNGTNFTLACPYVQLAHHSELEEVSEFGVDPNFVRVSVGLEDSNWLIGVFSNAIEVLRKKRSQAS